MVENYSQILFSSLKSSIIFLIAMLVTSSIAYIKGFYKLDKKEKINFKISYVAVVFFIYLFINIIIGPVIIKLSSHLYKKNLTGYLISINFIINILTLFFLYLYCVKKNLFITSQIIKKKSPFSDSLLKDASIGIISWLIAFPIVSFVSSVLETFLIMIFKVQKLPDQLVIEFIKSTINQPFYFGIAIFIIVIIAPLLEEFLFRGVLLNFFKLYLKRNTAVILSSFIFTIFHYSSSQGLSNISLLLGLFIFACFLSFLYERQKSLISPIFLHATFNAVSIINLIFIKGL